MRTENTCGVCAHKDVCGHRAQLHAGIRGVLEAAFAAKTRAAGTKPLDNKLVASRIGEAVDPMMATLENIVSDTCVHSSWFAGIATPVEAKPEEASK